MACAYHGMTPGRVWLTFAFPYDIDQDKTASFELKLMDIDAEHLALPVSFHLVTVTYRTICEDVVTCRTHRTVLWYRCHHTSYSVLHETCPSSMTLSTSVAVRKASSSPPLLTPPPARQRSYSAPMPHQIPRRVNRSVDHGANGWCASFRIIINYNYYVYN